MKLKLVYLWRAYRARRYYWNRGYRKTFLPCLSCTWEHDPEDLDTPWAWIYCHKCHSSSQHKLRIKWHQ